MSLCGQNATCRLNKISPKKEPRRGGVLRIGSLSDGVFLCGNVGSLEALRAFFYLKGDRLTFAPSPESH
jgi:hypothetical protein